MPFCQLAKIRGFTITASETVPLPNSDGLWRINNAGQVIGTDNQDYRAIWINGVHHRIVDLLAPGHEMTINSIHDLNNAGQILVHGRRNGVDNWYLLTPVPEPASLIGLGVGVVAVLRRRRAKRGM